MVFPSFFLFSSSLQETRTRERVCLCVCAFTQAREGDRGGVCVWQRKVERESKRVEREGLWVVH